MVERRDFEVELVRDLNGVGHFVGPVAMPLQDDVAIALVEVGRAQDDGGFESLASDDDGLSDTHAQLDWTAPEDGVYVVRARSYAPGAVGDYALTIEKQP